MIKRLELLFSSKAGKNIFDDAVCIIKEHSMDDWLSRGVLVGLSGGPDSVMLLCFLKKYAEKAKVGKILAVHVNHMIRGEEADRDERFSEEICRELGIEFLSVKRDVPNEAKELSLGIEEAARNIRYSIFSDLIQSRNDVSCIAVAHNSTDNLETVILNMMRGSGTRGVAGIPPVRDNIIRPLLYSSKKKIVSALSDATIPFVIDSTNGESEYRRNYVRNEILPMLYRLSDDPEGMVSRSSRNLRCDFEYIEAIADHFLNEQSDKTVLREDLSKLHPAVFSRVINEICRRGGATGVEYTHIASITELMSRSDNFEVSLPGQVNFLCRKGKCCVERLLPFDDIRYDVTLSYGENIIEPLGICIFLSDKPFDDFSSNVYKISIQTSIDFDIIKGDVRVRNKRDGDTYIYGGMTRKLKKLFNDKGISPELRSRVPVFYDDEGILWVKGFSVRDGGCKKSVKRLYIAIGEK